MASPDQHAEPSEPYDRLTLMEVMNFELDSRQTIDEWAESIKDWADILVMAGYNFIKEEEHRAFMLLVNLPINPLWADVHQRYPLCLEDGSWNPRYYYNGKWRLTLEALRDRLAFDFN